jgi:hypothetical protein
MNQNVGKVDKIVRFILGLAIVIAGFIYNSWWGLLGLVFIGSALVGRCLIYKIFWNFHR